MTVHDPFDARKAAASAWFEDIRNQICAAFEALEDAQDTGPFADLEPGRFERKETKRAGEAGEDAGGGVMSVMREGRVFEKVGVNISTVYGRLAE
ncbi:MAG: coproporphyrinogen III oxidase, partial [Pseudomonadota bacterium]